MHDQRDRMPKHSASTAELECYTTQDRRVERTLPSYPIPLPDSLSWRSIRTVSKLRKPPGHRQRNRPTPVLGPC